MFLLLLLGAASLPPLSLADLPVHCFQGDVQGTWEISVGLAEEGRSSCGHNMPDLVVQQPKGLKSVYEPTVTKFSVELTEDWKAHLVKTEKKVTEQKGAWWTMVADEGWEVNFPTKMAQEFLDLKGGNASFFAFSSYELTKPIPEKPDPNSKSKNLCNETMVGWYSVGRTQYGCWSGKQLVHKPPKKKVEDAAVRDGHADTSLIATTSHLRRTHKHRHRLTEEQKKQPEDIEADENLIDPNKPLTLTDLERKAAASNARSGGRWQAKAYKRWVGLSMVQLRKKRGLRSYEHPFSRHEEQQQGFVSLIGLKRRSSASGLPGGPTPEEKWLSLSRLVKHGPAAANATYKALMRKEQEEWEANGNTRAYLVGLAEAEKTLPKAVDWRNYNGVNYLEPVMDQQDCGSCYAVSASRMINARYKIKWNRPDAKPFSISFPLYCSEYNQGCEGGYGYLHARWGEDVGLVPAECAPYTPHGVSCAVNASCIQEHRSRDGVSYRVANHRYLNGADDAATAAALMHEIAYNGPVVVGLSGRQLGDDFMMYIGGVYTGEEKPPNQPGGHAIMLMGYGTDDLTGEPYWIIQNSWGAEWGEGGYIRVARRVVQFRTVEAADVVVDEMKGAQVDKIIKELPPDRKTGNPEDTKKGVVSSHPQAWHPKQRTPAVKGDKTDEKK